ncbi:hypothetical protein E2C01_077178 [Portunus trituberculatus]|uniref:Uncharacterized protein n=1 Tax=Portunus trituberculatus TaxID=210409 RepID=A0A5B7IP31_PORTR|nr:hypothetical protein [Portunus trituberculatus]
MEMRETPAVKGSAGEDLRDQGVPRDKKAIADVTCHFSMGEWCLERMSGRLSSLASHQPL